MAALQGPSRAQAAQALDFALEPKGSPCTRALGWPGWSLEGKQSMLTMARLTVALLPTNMLRGMLRGEGDKPAAATSAAARHARLRCEEHARLRAGAREAHVPFACSTYAFACQYRASTRPAHTCTRGAPALRQPAYNYPCRRPRSHPHRLGHGEGHGRSQRGRRRTMHAGAASNSPVRG